MVKCLRLVSKKKVWQTFTEVPVPLHILYVESPITVIIIYVISSFINLSFQIRFCMHKYFISEMPHIEKRTSKESPKQQTCKMLQDRLVRVCSWTVLVSANYRSRPGLSRKWLLLILNFKISADSAFGANTTKMTWTWLLVLRIAA